MTLKDCIRPPKKIRTENWQLGSLITDEITEGSVVLLFAPDYRGGGRKNIESNAYDTVRRYLYRLSRLDFQVPICDLGDLILGKTLADTHYILQEIATLCHQYRAVPVMVGGSSDLAFPLFSVLNHQQKSLRYTHISNFVSLSNLCESVSEANFLSKIFSDKEFSIREFSLLGYQKHLNALDAVKLMNEVDFEVVRLSEMMGTTTDCEPFFRRADLVTLNCDAVESFADAFSVNPQVNGLNRREICAYVKEIGLGEQLKSFGIFNFNIHSRNLLNYQLLAQMIWYFLEGLNIQRSHPKQREYETYIVMVEELEYVFKRDTFSGLWYFGDAENIENCVPCSVNDYENAKRGILAKRLK